jgi:arylsulfatase A-like enzyme
MTDTEFDEFGDTIHISGQGRRDMYGVPLSPLSLRAVAVVLSVAALACQSEPPTEGVPERPNVLLILTDDQRADALGAWGNPYIRTPTLDDLAGRGFNFRGAHIMGSHHGAVCAPSRAMLMSGRTLFRVYDDLDPVPTLPEVLRKNGYVTFGTGKWHQSRESFARSFSRGRRLFFGGMSDHEAVPVQDLLPDGGFSEVKHEGFSTDLFVEAAIDFVEDHAATAPETPFLAYVALTAPHDPRTPPEEYRAMYPGEGMPLPPSFMPVHPFHNGWMTGRDEQLAAWPREPGVIREQLGEYYGLISHLDARVGDLLEALEHRGLAERTLVVFTSDNGLALGSHGLLGKQSLYEHSTHVPLIFAGPGIPPGESPALVMLYDLFPTIAGLTGSEIPPGVEGMDLSGLWRGEAEGVREVIYTAYEDKQRSVRDHRFKLIRYPPLDHVQLFDLERDPFELRNLAGDPEYAGERARLTALLEAEHAALEDPHPLASETRASMAFDYESVEREPDPHQPPWVVEKYFRR